ncbi:hypothetical protein LCGC14_1431640 [marine sediment metagenome]|uniref:Methyltransferase domain-containing protein n=1 Tax=marine sediment metagenome TaxID=412755 RepID=A0A0F9M3Z7_9ZZZZ
MEINFRKPAHMQEGDPHPHSATMSIQKNWIKYDKGHYVTRPYQKYVTSKWEQSMLDVYEIIFDHLKHAPIDMLEIGVYAGESMRYFRDYFTHADTRLVGADRNPPTKYGGIAPEGYTLEIGDQGNSAFRQRLADTYGPFDIIMDDASHDLKLTNDTFDQLWPYVKPEGFYIIEDMPYEEMHHLLDEIVSTRQGKGFISRDSRGFGPGAVAGTIVVLKKTINLMTGVDEVLTND